MNVLRISAILPIPKDVNVLKSSFVHIKDQKYVSLTVYRGIMTMTKSLNLDRLQLGVCHYPEHWPEELWADDFRRMRELGFSVIRIAEFAWTIFEPEEGRFCFDLFDRAIALAQEYGLQVILGTPTATPPAWLMHT